MSITNETLAAIEEAWAKVDPLAKQYPFEHSDFTCDRGELVPFHEDVAKYLVLAANHADTLAAELRELRAKMERVREILGKQVDDHGTYIPSSDTEARELAELINAEGK